jgi:hypothetical protein
VADLWAFLSDPHNQAILSWLGGGLVVVAGGAWTVIKFMVGPKDKGEGGAAPAPSRTVVRADRGGIAGGRDVSVRTSHGLSGLYAVLLISLVVGAVLLAGGLLGKRITAMSGVAAGGDISGSTITTAPSATVNGSGIANTGTQTFQEPVTIGGNPPEKAK